MADKAVERRRAPRFRLCGPAQFEAQGAHGHGMVADVSLTGVRIEEASCVPSLRSPISLHWSYQPGSFEVELTGQVVRHTETGFAVDFSDLTDRAQELLYAALPGRSLRLRSP